MAAAVFRIVTGDTVSGMSADRQSESVTGTETALSSSGGTESDPDVFFVSSDTLATVNRESTIDSIEGNPIRIIPSQSQFIAVANPTPGPDDIIKFIYRGRYEGRIAVTIYDPTGSIVNRLYGTTRKCGVTGYTTAVLEWNCRNRNERIVGRGAYCAIAYVINEDGTGMERKRLLFGVTD